MMPAPADIRYFIEIAETLNLSRAAERLGIRQPSLTLAVQRLEAAVGAPLLSRSKRGVALTQAGRQFLAHARHLLQLWADVRAATKASAEDVQGAYTIGCHPSVALNTLAAALPPVMARYPKLDIRLTHDLSRKVAEDVISLKADIGIVVNPVPHPDLVIQRLCTDEVTLWTAAGTLKPAQDMAGGAAVLICDPELMQSQALLKRLKKSGPAFARTVTSGNLEVIADLTAAGLGIGILPTRVARRARGKLRPVAGAPLHLDAHCVIYRVEQRGVKSIQALTAAIKSVF